MNENDKTIYKEIQKNSDMAIKAIDAISPKIKNGSMKQLVKKQGMRFTSLKNRAANELARENVERYKPGRLSEMMLKSGIYMNTMFHADNARIAELLMKGNNMGIIEAQRIVNRNRNAYGRSISMARELLELEESSIEDLKPYL